MCQSQAFTASQNQPDDSTAPATRSGSLDVGFACSRVPLPLAQDNALSTIPPAGATAQNDLTFVRLGFLGLGLRQSITPAPMSI